MNRMPVRSSNLASVGYDEISQTLEVEFTNNTVYQYFDVPTSEYHGLMGATSKGHYFDVNIKKKGYQFKKIS